LDIGVGYNFKRNTVTFGRDLLNSRYQVALGVSSTRRPPPASPPAAPPAPAPEPEFDDSSFFDSTL
jgi:hypothetical protein